MTRNDRCLYAFFVHFFCCSCCRTTRSRCFALVTLVALSRRTPSPNQISISYAGSSRRLVLGAEMSQNFHAEGRAFKPSSGLPHCLSLRLVLCFRNVGPVWFDGPEFWIRPSDLPGARWFSGGCSLMQATLFASAPMCRHASACQHTVAPMCSLTHMPICQCPTTVLVTHDFIIYIFFVHCVV